MDLNQTQAVNDYISQYDAAAQKAQAGGQNAYNDFLSQYGDRNTNITQAQSWFNPATQNQYKDANGNLLPVGEGGASYSDEALNASVAREMGAQGLSPQEDAIHAIQGLAWDPNTGTYSKKITPYNPVGSSGTGGQYAGEAMLTPSQVTRQSWADAARTNQVMSAVKTAQANLAAQASLMTPSNTPAVNTLARQAAMARAGQTISTPAALQNPANPPAAVAQPTATPAPAPAPANQTIMRTPGTSTMMGAVPATPTAAPTPAAAQTNPLLRTPTTFPATPAALVNPATPPAAATPATPTMMRTAAAPSPTPAAAQTMAAPPAAPIAATPTALRTTTALPSVAPAMMQGTALTGTQAQQGGQLGNLTLPATGMTVPGIAPAVKMPGLTAAGQAQPNLAAQNAFLQTGLVKPAAPQFPVLPKKRVATTQPVATTYRATRAPARKTVNLLG